MSPRDIRIYRRREKLEKEYKEKCGKLLDFIREKRQHRWHQLDICRRGGVKTHAQVQSEGQLKELSKSTGKPPGRGRKKGGEKTGRAKAEQRSKSEQLKRGLHSIIQNPRKFYKDYLGEKKSAFAKGLATVKGLIESNKKLLRSKRKRRQTVAGKAKLTRFFSPRKT